MRGIRREPDSHACDKVAFWQRRSDVYSNAMPRSQLLPDHIREALEHITSSDGGGIKYHPCKVELKDGRILDNVYIEPEEPYLRTWGVYPEDDRGKMSIPIQEVLKVEDSPARLPAHFAEQLYRAGESGMGYTIFTVVFSDGRRQAYSSGTAVDFIRYPDGKSGLDVVAVEPHEGRGADPMRSPGWYWCLYSVEGS